MKYKFSKIFIIYKRNAKFHLRIEYQTKMHVNAIFAARTQKKLCYNTIIITQSLIFRL